MALLGSREALLGSREVLLASWPGSTPGGAQVGTQIHVGTLVSCWTLTLVLGTPLTLDRSPGLRAVVYMAGRVQGGRVQGGPVEALPTRYGP